MEKYNDKKENELKESGAESNVYLSSYDYARDMSEAAKKTIDTTPYQVDFANKQVCTSSETIPKYRRAGLKTYGTLLRENYLAEMGIISKKTSINKDKRNAREIWFIPPSLPISEIFRLNSSVRQ